MSAEAHGEVTSLLEKVRQGNEDAANQLVPLVYDELRRMAGALTRTANRRIPCKPPNPFTRLT